MEFLKSIDWKRVGREVGLYTIALSVFWGLFYSLEKLFNAPIPSENREPLLIVLGFLTAKAGDIVAYFFGSSKGSADKTEHLVSK